MDKFYATLELEMSSHEELLDELEHWQDHYTWHRMHGTIGQALMDKLLNLWDHIPEWEEVVANYDLCTEQWRSQMLDLEKCVS